MLVGGAGHVVIMYYTCYNILYFHNTRLNWRCSFSVVLVIWNIGVDCGWEVVLCLPVTACFSLGPGRPSNTKWEIEHIEIVNRRCGLEVDRNLRRRKKGQKES